jgi:hypothetical protein
MLLGLLLLLSKNKYCLQGKSRPDSEIEIHTNDQQDIPFNLNTSKTIGIANSLDNHIIL